MNIDWSSDGVVFEYSSSPLDELVHERVSSSLLASLSCVSSCALVSS